MHDIIPINKPWQVEKIAKLAREIWTEYYIPIIGFEQVEYMLAEFQSVPALTRQITEDNFEYFFLASEGTPVGYFAVQPHEDSLYLSKLYVKASERGRGFGRTAMAFIEKHAREKGLDRITLNVNRNNEDSIKAYEKMGFRKEKIVDIDIGQNYKMHDYVMEKKLL